MRSGRAALAAALLLWGGSAQAQVSGSLSLESDYRYRGYSLNGGRPVAKLLLSYDAPSGWYGGVQARRPRTAPGDADSTIDLLGFAGYAVRLAGGVALDAGVTAYTYSAAPRTNYREIQLGVSTDRLSARISYGPDYLGFGLRTWYLQTEAAYPVADGWSLFGHLGHMRTSGANGLYGQRTVTDVRAGVGTALGEWNVQLALDGADTGAYNGFRNGSWTRAARSNLLLIVNRPF